MFLSSTFDSFVSLQDSDLSVYQVVYSFHTKIFSPYCKKWKLKSMDTSRQSGLANNIMQGTVRGGKRSSEEKMGR